MRWPWTRPAPAGGESRESGSYSDAVIGAILARAGNDTASPATTAALEACAGHYSRAMMSATVTPANDTTAAVTAAVLAQIGRDLIRRGESVHLIEVDRDGIRLAPAGTWDISGGPDAASWLYRLDRFGPSGSRSVVRPAAAVLHCRYATDAARPWRGVAPLTWANQSGRLAGNVERRLADEAGAPVGNLIPIPAAPAADDADDADEAADPLAGLKTALRKMRGNHMLVETTAGGFGEGSEVAPRHDWRPQRVGAHPPEALVSLRRDAAQAVASACGVPISLIADRSDGTSQRESWRRFLHGSIQPVARMIEGELADKLDVPGLALNFDSLFASDLSGRARAMQSMVNGGMPLADAAALAGLMAPDD